MAAMMQQMMGGQASAAAPAAPAANPMAAMMQQMMGAQAGAAASPAAPAPNPMATMMQQMMSNPAQTQQMAGMSPQLLGGGGYGAGAAMGGQAGVAPAANPMASMMQQMMSDPAQMQQMMALTQQLMGGGLGSAMPSNTVDTAGSLDASAQRARFSEQLSQLVAMGFSNEELCLRVLAQNNGRVDASIDALLSMGD